MSFVWTSRMKPRMTMSTTRPRRDNFRLHHPGRTIGCIAAKDWKDWNKVFNLISNTKTSTVPDNFKPWWKFWSSPGSLRDFGTLTVVP